jgi:hypothetical protein
MPKMYRTAQGRVVDFEAMQLKNEHVPAVGNMRVNARGDELGEDHSVVRNNNERVAEYYTAQHPAQESAAPLVTIEESLPQLLDVPRDDTPLIVDKPKRKEKNDV